MNSITDVKSFLKATRSPSDVNGSTRDVWFFGDVVIKQNLPSQYNNTNYNQLEYDNYLKFSPATFEHKGATWTIRFPVTLLVGQYLVMDFIDLPECINMERCKNSCQTYEEHDDECYDGLLYAIESAAAKNYGLWDVHEGNYRVDWDTNTIWLIDFSN